jgi:hypothetical protein
MITVLQELKTTAHRWRWRFAHASRADLVAFADGEWETEDSAILKLHLGRCEQCRQRVAELSRELAELDSLVFSGPERIGETRAGWSEVSAALEALEHPDISAGGADLRRQMRLYVGDEVAEDGAVTGDPAKLMVLLEFTLGAEAAAALVSRWRRQGMVSAGRPTGR